MGCTQCFTSSLLLLSTSTYPPHTPTWRIWTLNPAFPIFIIGQKGNFRRPLINGIHSMERLSSVITTVVLLEASSTSAAANFRMQWRSYPPLHQPYI
eukprot:scaffold3834_cov179-Ochromonas_danica.AAC.6